MLAPQEIARIRATTYDLPPHPELHTLRKVRESLSLTKSKFAALCFLAAYLPPEEFDRVTQILRETRVTRCLDASHLSKFESGCVMPWGAAMASICQVVSALTGQPHSPSDLFPEILPSNPEAKK